MQFSLDGKVAVVTGATRHWPGHREAARAVGISYEEFLQNYANESMLKRLNRVEEVAAMALLLASEAGSGITGRRLAAVGGSGAVDQILKCV